MHVGEEGRENNSVGRKHQIKKKLEYKREKNRIHDHFWTLVKSK